ncbi:MAG: PUR family DNA/RNA-binding protein [Bacteroidaceae bacterium]|nr:PUR family DNA/RNA-binding protein [Bacteroidaceae bacterium]
MEDLKKKAVGQEGGDKDIIFSKAIKAGKRIYYLDVKKSRNDEMYLAITESKKIYAGIGENAQLNFEKHKIFLYREDFEKFMNGLNEAVQYIVDAQGPCQPRTNYQSEEFARQTSDDTASEEPIRIDIDF